VNYLDLFSGIGGFPKGAYEAGMKFESHYFSEIDPWASELYQKRFPDAIPLGDIRGIDGKALADTGKHGRNIDEDKRDGGTLGRAAGQASGERDTQAGDVSDGRETQEWLITGGFPCQDISYAGAGAGLAGERSGLWYEFHRLIGELRPRYVIVENVSALLTRGIDAVLGSLAALGYDAEWECIRASDVGAPHRRERVWIVAYPQEQPVRSRLCEDEPGGKRGRRPGYSGGEVTDAGCELPEGPTYRPEVWSEQPGRHWAVEPDVGRLAHGVPHRVDRLRGLGNAIVPQIAELIFRQIQEVEQ